MTSVTIKQGRIKTENIYNEISPTEKNMKGVHQSCIGGEVCDMRSRIDTINRIFKQRALVGRGKKNPYYARLYSLLPLNTRK